MKGSEAWRALARGGRSGDADDLSLGLDPDITQNALAQAATSVAGARDMTKGCALPLHDSVAAHRTAASASSANHA